LENRIPRYTSTWTALSDYITTFSQQAGRASQSIIARATLATTTTFLDYVPYKRVVLLRQGITTELDSFISSVGTTNYTGEAPFYISLQTSTWTARADSITITNNGTTQEGASETIVIGVNNFSVSFLTQNGPSGFQRLNYSGFKSPFAIKQSDALGTNVVFPFTIPYAVSSVSPNVAVPIKMDYTTSFQSQTISGETTQSSWSYSWDSDALFFSSYSHKALTTYASDIWTTTTTSISSSKGSGSGILSIAGNNARESWRAVNRLSPDGETTGLPAPVGGYSPISSSPAKGMQWFALVRTQYYPNGSSITERLSSTLPMSYSASQTVIVASNIPLAEVYTIPFFFSPILSTNRY
jgi:hypothetical protein